MLDRQLDDYPGHAHFTLTLLGLLSVCSGLIAALEAEGADAEVQPSKQMVEIALGVVSLARTLRAVVGIEGASELPSATPTENAIDTRWLR